MKNFKKEELKNKFVIGFDTLCDGNQCAKDDNENPSPTLHESHDSAFKELFEDAMCGIEGNEFAFEDTDLNRESVLKEMKALIKEDDAKKMKAYFDKHPEANYYNEFIESADEFIVGRKSIFTENGIVIEGTKLEDL